MPARLRPLEVLEPDIVALDPFAVVLEILEERVVELMLDDGNLGLALHVGLAGEDEDFDGLARIAGVEQCRQRQCHGDAENPLHDLSWVRRLSSHSLAVSRGANAAIARNRKRRVRNALA